MKVRAFNVLPKLPKALDPLRDIAYNIWFSWNWEAVQLFIRMDVEYWEKSYQNPALMLGVVPQERFEELARDEGFLATMNRVHAQFRAYMDAPTWFSKTYPNVTGRTIAYFSTEFGIDVGLPIYSGGLGVLAGDHLKSASDLGLPLVAVGLLYREGYLKQYLTADGWQQEAYPRNDWYNMPVTLVSRRGGQAGARADRARRARRCISTSGACRSAACRCSCWTRTCRRTRRSSARSPRGCTWATATCACGRRSSSASAACAR